MPSSGLRFRRLILPGALLLAGGAWALWDGGPSLSRGPTHEVEDEIVVEVSGQRVAAPRTYIVARGDTLGHIAQRELGSARAWQRIAELNPSIDPDALRPGTALRLPPAALGEASGEARADGHAFYLWQSDPTGPSGRLVPLSTGRPVRAGAAPARVLALPLAGVRAGEAALREASAFGRPLPALEGLVTGPLVEPTGLVALDDETSRVLHRVRIEAVTPGAIQAVVELERFDAKGRSVLPLPREAGSLGRPLLVGLALLLLVGAVLWFARRLEQRAVGFRSVDGSR